jgi:hypothetical protein
MGVGKTLSWELSKTGVHNGLKRTDATLALSYKFKLMPVALKFANVEESANYISSLLFQ